MHDLKSNPDGFSKFHILLACKIYFVSQCKVFDRKPDGLSHPLVCTQQQVVYQHHQLQQHILDL